MQTLGITDIVHPSSAHSSVSRKVESGVSSWARELVAEVADVLRLALRLALQGRRSVAKLPLGESKGLRHVAEWVEAEKRRHTHFLIEFVYIVIEILNIYFEHPTSDPKWSSKFLCLQCWTPAGGVGGLGYIAGVKLVFRSQKVAKLHAVPDRAFNMSNYGQYCNTLERATLNRSSPENSLDSRRPWIDTG